MCFQTIDKNGRLGGCTWSSQAWQKKRGGETGTNANADPTQKRRELVLCTPVPPCVCMSVYRIFLFRLSLPAFSPSLPPSLSLSLCLRPSASQSSREKEKKEKNLKQIHVTCQPVHGCIVQHVQNGQHSFFFLFASTDACLFLPPSFLLSSPPPYAAPGGWMAGAKSKQVWQVAQRRKTGAPAGRLALPTSATPALLCEPAARGCCVTVARRRLSSAEHCSGPLLAPSSCFRPPPAVAPARDQSGPDARPASEMWRV